MLKHGGLLALIVPSSFLADAFSDKSAIEFVNTYFNFISQYSLPDNAFKNMGVSKFPTKIMFFQKKSEHIAENPYVPADITSIENLSSNDIYKYDIVGSNPNINFDANLSYPYTFK